MVERPEAPAGVRAPPDLDRWLLGEGERGNAATSIALWHEGNRCTPLVHGATYFARLVEEVEALGEGDLLLFVDWRGEPTQRLREQGPTVAELLAGAARRGVVVRGLLWRSHWSGVRFSYEQHTELGDAIEEAGGQVILDQRVPRFGSHHQKLVVLRHPGAPERDVAFAGGIDLCHSRRDDATHRGDPQPHPMNAAYGDRPPWHDVQLEVRGPAVGAYETTFRERWSDPVNAVAGNPLARVSDRLRGLRHERTPLPAQLPDPPPAGSHVVQVLRTYASKRRFRYRFAPRGERSVARGYSKAVRRATRLIYLEDQYMWSREIAVLFAEALRADPDLHLVIVVPRHPDHDGVLAGAPNRVGRTRALSVCQEAAGDRVHVFDAENHEGRPVYVHSKVCVVDDVWASVGSDNFNRRSWTHDSELSSAVLDLTPDHRPPADPAGTGDGARAFARDLRLQLAREHLDREDGEDGDLVDPATFVTAVEATADALDAWYDGGCVGPRPPGRLRRHHVDPIGPVTRVWATVLYRLFYDPDGRPLRMRLRRRW